MILSGPFGLLLLAACSRTPPASSDPTGAPAKSEAGAASAETDPVVAAPPGATPCEGPGGPPCLRFDTAEEAFRYVLAKDPLVLAVGEAHAQKGTEGIASATKRFTETFLPLLAPRASDVVVELWAPDPKCTKEVKAVASAQKPVVEAQAATNQNEYVTLGTKAKAVGMTPWLLRPTCDDFGRLADAGADAVSAMLGLVKSLTQAKVVQLLEKQRSNGGGDGGEPRTVVAYGGALHNDLAPPAPTKEYSFGPELDRIVGGRYIELDLIVPEYVKPTPSWAKLVWFPSFEADRVAGRGTGKVTLYAAGERSFALVFAASPASPPAPKQP